MTLNGGLENLPAVEAVLNYVAPATERVRRGISFPSLDVPQTTAGNTAHKVLIRDARPVAKEITLDRNGFELVAHHSEVQNFYDYEELERVYYPETERLLKDVTGASRVVIFDHTTQRRLPGAEERSACVRRPVGRVQVDHTAKSALQRVRDLLADEAPDLLHGRFQVINVWRPIKGPLLDRPLAVCDARSVEPEDLVPSGLVRDDQGGETYSVTYRQSHLWFYFRGMRSDEVLLLKCYDSRAGGCARFTPSTAFADPDTPPNAPPRESIELRALVFHPPDERPVWKLTRQTGEYPTPVPRSKRTISAAQSRFSSPTAAWGRFAKAPMR
jgi:hypothetical protein